jgi:uncharacterized protein Smg (DUF494 family)
VTDSAPKDSGPSIFQQYYAKAPLEDRFVVDPTDAMDVIIPIIHTNELWHTNLLSLYREIPIRSLLIGDGGCVDNSIEIVSKFPRVEVHDHRKYVSLGYSLRKLIEAVKSEWFIYVHSDVYLPPGWFDVMKRHRGEYDWFGCPMRITVLADYHFVDKERPYAGSQMGRKEAFRDVSKIDDDFVYRQEDLVLANVVEQAGFKEGRIEDTFHYHQVMHKESPWARKIKSVAFNIEWSKAEEIRQAMTQVKGIIKYLDPTRISQTMLVEGVILNIVRLLELGELTWDDFRQWIEQTQPRWLRYITRRDIEWRRLKRRVATRLGR